MLGKVMDPSIQEKLNQEQLSHQDLVQISGFNNILLTNKKPYRPGKISHRNIKNNYMIVHQKIFSILGAPILFSPTVTISLE